ncbi:MAG: 8-oxoguanine glycosylase ogg1 [Alyxoria varia]|nr:MAG: 8-oxoguanine glycosylase ogg1 [Alyxoria varia]
MTATATLLHHTPWHKLPIPLTELCIDTTLRCGQSFRWKKTASGSWICALHGRILTLRQDSSFLHWRASFPSPSTSSSAHPVCKSSARHVQNQQDHPLTPPPSSPSSSNTSDKDAPCPSASQSTHDLLHHYFNLTPQLSRLYAEWSRADPNFARKAPRFTGVRILKQDPWEALVCFICSSNNNIARISQMVEKLCRYYGRAIGEVEGETYYDFPEPRALIGKEVERRLRDLGFGYRAKYLWRTACLVENEKGSGWLQGLRNPEAVSSVGGKHNEQQDPLPEGGRQGYRDAHEALLELQGVGPKVADCVCLMGLGWGEAVPVDTHVWQIAHRDYKFRQPGKHSSLTKATYDAVGDKFRALWGREAGWAHSVLFTADLKSFSEKLVKRLEREEVVEVVKGEEGSNAAIDVKQEVRGEELGNVVKSEDIDATVKTEDAGSEGDEAEQVVKEVTKKEVMLDKRVKREFEEREHREVEFHEDMVSRVKRRKRSQR